MIGQPIPVPGAQYPETIILNFQGTRICLDETDNTLIGFSTTSPQCCVLSENIPGGFKVGDTLERLTTMLPSAMCRPGTAWNRW